MMLRPPSRTALSLMVGSLLLAATTVWAQQLTATAAPIDATTTRLVTDMVAKFHISQRPVDDKVSSELLNRFLKELDPLKLYFLQSDVAKFEQYRDHLDDLLKAGDTEFAHQAFQVYQQRVKEAVAIAQKLVDEPQDFTLNEELVTDPDKITWTKTPEERFERWRRRVKYELLTQKLDNENPKLTEKKNTTGKPELVGEAKGIEALHKRYRSVLRSSSDIDDSELLEIYLSTLCHCFDPHSSYMSPATQEDFKIIMGLKLEGIGAALKADDGSTVVAQVVPGGAAEKDGRLKIGDRIEAVGQDTAEYQDITGMKLSRVVRLIRGPGGTRVRLRIAKESGEKSEILLTRQQIEIKDDAVHGEIINAPDRLPGATGRVGVINVPSFYRDFDGAQRGLENFVSTARDVKRVLDEFQSAGGVDAVIVDLRFNGGGALNEATEVSGLFVDEGPIVQIKGQSQRVKAEEDVERGTAYAGPLIVVCNRLSASASEIFAAAIKDYGRGIVVGDTTTHGKGTVQNVMPVGNQMFRVISSQERGSLKLTISQFYRVNGDSTQNKGVESDVVLPSILDHMDLGESFLDNALAFDRIPPARHIQYDMTTGAVVSEIKRLSGERMAADPKFQKIERNIARYLSRKDRKTVSLNEAIMRQEREADKAAEEAAREDEPEANKSKGPIFPVNEYNNELVQIALDYATLLQQSRTANR